MDRVIDYCFEWILGEATASVTFSQKKFVNKLKKLAKQYPDNVEIIAENEDGSICAHVPVSWFKFSPPKKGRTFTDEERAEAAERMKNAREKRKNESAKKEGSI